MPIAQARAVQHTNYFFGQTTAPTALTMPVTVIMTSTAGTSTAAGTAVTTIVSNPTVAAAGWTAASGATALSNNAALSWVSNAAIATITGVNLQDSTGTPIYLGYGSFGSNKSMNNGDTLTIAIAGLTGQIL
jgi:hypothetical protein